VLEVVVAVVLRWTTRPSDSRTNRCSWHRSSQMLASESNTTTTIRRRETTLTSMPTPMRLESRRGCSWERSSMVRCRSRSLLLPSRARSHPSLLHQSPAHLPPRPPRLPRLRISLERSTTRRTQLRHPSRSMQQRHRSRWWRCQASERAFPCLVVSPIESRSVVGVARSRADALEGTDASPRGRH